MPISLTNSVDCAAQSALDGGSATLFAGDCLDLIAGLPDCSVNLTLTSPPYCIGKSYDTSRGAHEFVNMHRKLLPEVLRVTAAGGSICWQVGYHVNDGKIVPLDFLG